MKPLRIHILPEYSGNREIHGTAHIRLLRPCSHPTLADRVEATFGFDGLNSRADACLVDRTWRPDIDGPLASQLVESIRKQRSALIYFLDDNFFDLADGRKSSGLSEGQIAAVDIFLQQADGVVVTTNELRTRVSCHNPRIFVIPNAIDERLLPNKPRFLDRARGARERVIGYMGTYSHDGDLLMILPALRQICSQNPGRIAIQFAGAIGQSDTLNKLAGIPYGIISVPYCEAVYPRFIRWFCTSFNWDIGLAPLEQNAFNHCKSDIKFLDYAAAGVAGIFSQVPAYERSIVHRETGWITNNEISCWVGGLQELLFNEELRKKIIGNAYDYLMHERTLSKCAFQWWDCLRSIVDAKS